MKSWLNFSFIGLSNYSQDATKIIHQRYQFDCLNRKVPIKNSNPLKQKLYLTDKQHNLNLLRNHQEGVNLTQDNRNHAVFVKLNDKTQILNARQNFKQLMFKDWSSGIEDALIIVKSIITFPISLLIGFAKVAELDVFMYEGDEVTILGGSVKFDNKANIFQVNNPLSIFMGSKFEFMHFLREQRDSYFNKSLLYLMGACIFSASLYFTKHFIQSNNRNNQEVQNLIQQLDEEGENNDQVQIDDPEDRFKCKICFTKNRELITYPCSHFNMCKSCAKDSIQSDRENSNKCPFCRETIQAFTKVDLRQNVLNNNHQ
eukprot:403361546